MEHGKYKEQQKPQYHENFNLRQHSKAKQKKVKGPFASTAQIKIKAIIGKYYSFISTKWHLNAWNYENLVRFHEIFLVSTRNLLFTLSSTIIKPTTLSTIIIH